MRSTAKWIPIKADITVNAPLPTRRYDPATGERRPPKPRPSQQHHSNEQQQRARGAHASNGHHSHQTTADSSRAGSPSRSYRRQAEASHAPPPAAAASSSPNPEQAEPHSNVASLPIRPSPGQWGGVDANWQPITASQSRPEAVPPADSLQSLSITSPQPGSTSNNALVASTNGSIQGSELSQGPSPISGSPRSYQDRQLGAGPNGHGDFVPPTIPPPIDRSPVVKSARFPAPGFADNQWEAYPSAVHQHGPPPPQFHGGRGRGRGRGRGGSFRGRGGMNHMNGMANHGVRSPPLPPYASPHSPPTGLPPLGYPFDPATAAYYLPYGPPPPAGPAPYPGPHTMTTPFIPPPQYDRPRPQLNYDPPLDPVRFWTLGQIEFYMSSDNLARDPFLRSQVRRSPSYSFPFLREEVIVFLTRKEKNRWTRKDTSTLRSLRLSTG
jgi:hypothetical protein